MSTVSVARGPGGPRGQGLRPALRLLAPPLPRRWRPSFVAVCAMIMLGCLAALLGINILLTRGAYTEQQLTLRQTALMESQQALSEKVAAQSSPELLGQRARSLGMIPNSSPAFIELRDGTIAGSPSPASLATAPEAADLLGTPLTPEQQAAAAAEANGGVPAFGGAPSETDSTVPLDDPGQGEPPATSGSAGATSDGAVLVESPSSAAQSEVAEQPGAQGGESRSAGESHANQPAGEGPAPDRSQGQAQTPADAEGASQAPAQGDDRGAQDQAGDGAVLVGDGQ